ncbi:MAG: YraN family protein [Planctomycetota bacterium]
MPSSRQQSGRCAEAYVAEELGRAGWELLAKNLRTPYAEVDLVLREPRGAYVLVEVKARGTGAWLSGEDQLGAKQRLRLLRAALWIGQQAGQQEPCRLDLALVDLIGGFPVSWRRIEDIGID